MSAANTEGSARVAVLEEFEGPIEVREVPIPDPEPGALVVRVGASSICGSDVHLWEGLSAKVFPTHLPLILGHEIVGAVERIGDGAELDSIGQELALGDRVVWTPAPCRRCHTCTVLKQTNLCPNMIAGMHSNCTEFPYVTGGFGEFSYVFPTSGRVRVPDAVPDAWAAAASCAVRSAMSAVRTAGTIRTGDHVLVQGAGPLGLFTTAICSLSDASSITVVDADSSRLALAADWGATTMIDVRETDADSRRELILAATGGRGPDIAFECSGAPGAPSEGIDVLATAGRYVIAGTVAGAPPEIAISRICTRALQVRGVFSAEVDEYWRALQFMDRHRDRFDWDRIFGKSYGLDEAGRAIEAMRNREEIKPVIVPGKGLEQ